MAEEFRALVAALFGIDSALKLKKFSGALGAVGARSGLWPGGSRSLTGLLLRNLN